MSKIVCFFIDAPQQLFIHNSFHNYVCDVQLTKITRFPTKTEILMIIVCLCMSATCRYLNQHIID